MNKSYSKKRHIQEANQRLEERVLSEQPDSRFGAERYLSMKDRANPSGESLYNASEKQMKDIHSINPHTLLSIVGIASLFIPVVGPFVTAGIGMMDAGTYLKEGKSKEAAIVGLFSLLPGIIKVTKLIPQITGLGVKGMAALGSKVASGAALTTGEAAIVDTIAANQAIIKTEAEAVAKNMATKAVNSTANSTVKQSLKHIAKHGVEKGTEEAIVHANATHNVDAAHPNVAAPVANTLKPRV